MSVLTRRVEDKAGEKRLVFYSPDSEEEWIDASVDDIASPKWMR